MKNNKNNNCNFPTLRFPEFTGEWKEVCIADILTIGSGKDYKGLGGGNIPVYGTGGYMTSVDGYLYDGESVCIGRKGTINKPIFLKGKFWTVDTLFFTHSFRGIIPKFSFYLFENINWLKYNEASGVPSLSKATIESIQTKIPSIIEQEKIALFLSLIDERIATQNKIIANLESQIKGLYYFMLGESSLYMYLGEICEIKKGNQINSTELSSEGEYYVMNGGISPSGFYNHYNIEGNTISISEGGNSCGYVQYNYEPFWSGGHCYTLNNIDERIIHDKYLFHYLKGNESQIMALRVGSGLPNIQKKDLSQFRIPIPSIDQQKEVANTLDGLTAKKDIEIAILSQYIKQRSYLLQKLFI